MYQENEFDKLENVDSAVSGLVCLAHMLEIVDDTADSISQKDFAEILRSIAFRINRETRETVKILHNKA